MSADDPVAVLLAASRRAHALYLQHLPRIAAMPGQGAVAQSGDKAESLLWMKEAAASRAQAQVIDPDHQSPAWAAEASTHPHGELMLEYLRALSK